MRNDRAWLLENRPPPLRRGRMLGDKYFLEDWKSRDRKFAAQVDIAGIKLRAQLGRPVRISASAICRAISVALTEEATMQKFFSNDTLPTRSPSLRPSHIHKKEVLNQLPKTSEKLSQVVESAVEFARRRLLWAAEEYRKDAIIFTRHQLLEKAGVRTLVDKGRHRPESVTLNILVDELCPRTASNTDGRTIEQGLEQVVGAA